MRFVPVEDALAHVLKDHGTVTTHMPDNPGQYAPLIFLMPVPSASDSEDFLAEDRFLVAVHAEGRTKTRDLAYEIAAFLDGSYFDTPHGMLDRVEVYMRPNESPLEDDTMNSFNFSILVQTRALP